MSRRQQRRCNLVQQRLKDVVVVAVYQDHPRRRSRQSPGGGDSAEASADNHDCW